MARRTATGILAWAIAVVALTGGSACGARAEQSVDLDLRITHKPALISIGMDDFDLVKARFKALKGTFVFKDAKGVEVGSYDVDYTLPVARSHVLFKKKAGVLYASVAVKLVDGEATILEKTLPIPPVTETAAPGPLRPRGGAPSRRDPVGTAERSLTASNVPAADVPDPAPAGHAPAER